MVSFIVLFLKFMFLMNESGFLGKFSLECIVKEDLFLMFNLIMLFFSIRLFFKM